MTLKRTAAALANRLLGLVHAEVTSKIELQQLRLLRARFDGLPDCATLQASLPHEAIDYLRPDNIRLLDLKSRYRAVNLPFSEHSKWSEELVSTDIDLRYFRSDSAYVYQNRDFNASYNYFLTAYFLKSIDKLGLFDSLLEDDLFGVLTIPFNNRHIISRDLLDSISELLFLEETLEISKLSRVHILDIGAGYGRLAHRLITAFPDTVEMFCVDAVAESTFLCEFYLDFRGVDDRARVVALDEVEGLMNSQAIDLAINIHSFSECTLRSVCCWLDLIRRYAVRHIMIVPNAEDNGGVRLMTFEKDGSRLDYLREMEIRGYRLKTKRPKFVDPGVQNHGVSPTYYYLFELSH